MAKIKICGIRSIQDVKIVNDFKPDYIGFIFARDRRRYIEPKKALEIKKELCEGIKTVGVFVNESEETVAEIAKSGIMDIIQLHGTENNSYIQRIKKATNLPVIKAFKITCPKDISIAAASKADMILLDNGIGGTGEKFDWSLIKELARPYFLAGGLNSSNIRQAISFLSPFAVDASSGVETDGVKDRTKVKEFIEIVRSI